MRTTHRCRSAPRCGCAVGWCRPTTATWPALLRPSGDAEVVDPPGPWWRAAGARSGRRCATRWRTARPTSGRWCRRWSTATTPRVDPDLQEAFRATGLTHLLAVSGTNLTLVVGFLLALARWCRVRGRWLHVVAAAGIVGFVLIARTEPSVLRAAVMGTIGLVALGADGRHRALRGLGTAVVVLVLLDPGLAVSAGFALSVLATGGILLLAPAWRDALARWLPRWLAEAIAVPAAAQLACTPLVAAISGQVSLVAVVANLLVAPVVGPATVLGLAGGLLTLVWAPLGRLCGTLASWCVAWLVDGGRARRGPADGRGRAGGPGAAALVAADGGDRRWWPLAGPRLLRRPVTGVAAALVLVVAVLVRPPAFGWPPDGWVLVACDVGQGDALVLNAGAGQAVVVDAGPEPARGGPVPRPAPASAQVPAAGAHPLPRRPRRRDRRGVRGARGRCRRRPPGCSTRRAGCARSTTRRRAPGSVPRRRRTARRSRSARSTVQVLWPPPDSPTRGPGDGSTANEASVVLLVEVGGLRLLLTGDVEPEGQAELARLLPGLRVDVLKMPHHGSAHQDEPWLLSLDPAVVLVSVGADNDYGHPAESALAPA